MVVSNYCLQRIIVPILLSFSNVVIPQLYPGPGFTSDEDYYNSDERLHPFEESRSTENDYDTGSFDYKLDSDEEPFVGEGEGGGGEGEFGSPEPSPERESTLCTRHGECSFLFFCESRIGACERKLELGQICQHTFQCLNSICLPPQRKGKQSLRFCALVGAVKGEYCHPEKLHCGRGSVCVDRREGVGAAGRRPTGPGLARPGGGGGAFGRPGRGRRRPRRRGGGQGQGRGRGGGFFGGGGGGGGHRGGFGGGGGFPRQFPSRNRPGRVGGWGRRGQRGRGQAGFRPRWRGRRKRQADSSTQELTKRSKAFFISRGNNTTQNSDEAISKEVFSSQTTAERLDKLIKAINLEKLSKTEKSGKLAQGTQGSRRAKTKGISTDSKKKLLSLENEGKGSQEHVERTKGTNKKGLRRELGRNYECRNKQF